MSNLKCWIILLAAFLASCSGANGSAGTQNTGFSIYEGKLNTSVTHDPFGQLLAVPKSVSVIRDQQTMDKVIERLGVIEDDKISDVGADFSSQQAVLITLGELGDNGEFVSVQLKQVNESEDFVTLETELSLLKSTNNCAVSSTLVPVYLILIDTRKPLVIKESVITKGANC